MTPLNMLIPKANIEPEPGVQRSFHCMQGENFGLEWSALDFEILKDGTVFHD